MCAELMIINKVIIIQSFNRLKLLYVPSTVYSKSMIVRGEFRTEFDLQQRFNLISFN